MCPPWVDQTERTSQRWALLAPELDEQIDLFYPRDYNDRNQHTPASDLHDVWPSNAFQMLAEPSKGSFTPQHLPAAIITSHLAPIENLPAELIMAVLEEIEQPKDIIALGVCSSTLWSHTLQHVATKIRRTRARWAGTSMICTGNYLKDLPPSLRYLLPESAKQSYGKGLGVRGRSGKCPARQWNSLASSCYDSVADRDTEIRTWLEALSGWVEEEGLGMAHLKPSLEHALTWQKDDQTESWVLRNLKSREFVPLSLKNNEMQQARATVKDAPWLSLERTLLQRICWSDFRAYRYDNKEEKKTQKRCHRGVWAGDCFDVVREDGFDAEGWRDVSHGIVEEAKDAWKLRDPEAVFQETGQGEVEEEAS